ncbi:MAG: hypothetical protein WBP93_12970 [Pyrinomonadaceae bacterium]
MTIIRTFALMFLLPAGAVLTFAQSDQAGKSTTRPDPTVTISISAEGVRFAALGSIKQMRVEVFNASGDSLYSSEFQQGNVRDWSLQDKQGQALPDGTYQCVVTLRDLSGRLSIKQGSVVLQSGQASLQLSESAQAADAKSEKALAPVTDSNATATTLLVHNGEDGQVVSTRGGLTFRAGDFFAGKDRELMRLTPDGNLGVGVQTPQAKLDVAGNIRASGFMYTAKGFEFADGTVQTTGLSGRKDAQGNIIPSTSGTGTVGRLAKWIADGGVLGDSIVTESNGNIGIGTNNPSSLLHIGQFGGYGATTGLLLGNNLNGTQYDRSLQVAPVQVASPSANSILLYALPTVNSGVTVPNQFGFFVDVKQGPGIVTSYAALATGQAPNLGATNNTHLLMGKLTIPSGNYAIYDNTGYNSYFSGNVGIGTISPSAKLDVTGDIRVTGNATISGNIAAKYQDVAEWVPARRQIAASTVVSLDLMQSNAVSPSARAYDTHVAGVVSAQPGVVLGEGGAGKVMVATTGRVRVKVDASRHPVRIGDLLVTSNKPGMAMRSQPIKVAGTLLHRPGTIIGKALEPLASGEGEILVLLSLQ